MAISIDRPEDVTAKAPVLSTADASGGEDTAIALDIAAALSDPDGSETLSITVSGVPEGAVLSAGTDNGDGSWSLAPADLTGLTITPPANSDARSEEHTSELQSLMRISYAVFCLKTKTLQQR